MDEKKKKAIMESDTFEDLLDAEYGEKGTEARDAFESGAESFCLAECLKEQRRLAGLTQEQLALYSELSYDFIRRIETSQGKSGFSVNTLYKIATVLEVKLDDLIKESNA